MDSETRSAIERATQRARKLLEGDLSTQLEGTFDVRISGVIAPGGGPHLTPRQAAQREKIVAAIEHKLAAGMAAAAAVADYLRDAAFTMLNRAVALKMLEARGLVQECISKGDRSAGYGEFAGMVPGVTLLPDGGGYRLYLESLFDELSTEVRVLFDRRDPAGLLWPKRQVFEDLLILLNAPELAAVWAEDETIGWVYQYFNSRGERKALRDPKQGGSQAPRNSRELAVRNQFFTPRYVVQYLVDNTLGRTWIGMQRGASGLVDQCDYFVRDGSAGPTRAKKDPRDLKILDPACGSGHFLLYSFDLLLVMYEESWNDPDPPMSAAGTTLRHDYPDPATLRRDLPLLILEHNLHGVDIDPRCAQIAALALWMRAQRAWHDFGFRRGDRPRITRTHIVVAEPMPGDAALVDTFAAALEPPLLRGLFGRMIREMRLAGELGVLLRVGEAIAGDVHLARELYAAERRQTGYLPGLRPAAAQGELDLTGLDDNRFFDEAEARLIDALRHFAESASGGPGVRRRLFAGDAAQGIALIDLLRTRFDVVLMNPPFGESAVNARDYLKSSFPDAHHDLLQCFVQRALECAHPSGVVGVLSARTGFFMGDSESWRTSVVWANQLLLFADLGLGVLDDALVEAAAYVIQHGTDKQSAVVVTRHLSTRDKEQSLRTAIRDFGHVGSQCRDVFVVPQQVIEMIPGGVFGYWAPLAFLKRFEAENSFERHIGTVRQGLATADDFRFVRLSWEVPANSIGRDRRWTRFSKGGEYSPPYDDIHLLVEWDHDGRALRSFPNAFVRNDRWYYKAGATYTVRTASAFAAKILPAGCIFSHNAQSWFVGDQAKLLRSVFYFLARVPQAYMELLVGGGDVATSGSAARRYTTSVVHSVPSSVVESVQYEDIDEDCRALLRLVAWDQALDETTCLFAGSRVQGVPTLRAASSALATRRQRLVSEALRASYRLDRAVIDAWELSPAERDFLCEEVGPHPCDYPRVGARGEMDDLLARTEADLVGLAVDRLGAKRWITKKSFFADRRTELICHMLRCDPESVEAAAAERAVPGDLSLAVDLVSVAVGVSFGRWRAEPAGAEVAEGFVASPFAELPQTPPAADSTGHAGAIMADDPGHSQSIEAAVADALRRMWPHHAHDVVTDLADALGTDLGSYLRRSFFKQHVSRYSKSRRAAPVYWQIATPSARYSVWLYAHGVTKDSLLDVQADFVGQKLRHEDGKLTAMRQAAGPSPTAGQRKEIEAQETFVDELRALRDEVARVAPLWSPDLNDGVVLTMAPLWRLVPHDRAWQKELKEAWGALGDGAYDWAHVAMHLWPERVVLKCATDRSLAIVHGLEEIFWEEDAGGKWRARLAPTRPLDELIRERTSPAVKAALKSLLEAPDSGAGAKRRGRARSANAPGGPS